MKLMLDNKCFIKKPVGIEVSGISNRIINSPVTINSMEELAQEIIKGKSFIPAHFQKDVNGYVKRKKEYWYSQELIALDFDDGMSVEEATRVFSKTGAFIYTTFSHTDTKHKFRVVFKLDRIIYKIDEYNKIIKTLLSQYPQSDQQCKDCTRLFYGGRKIFELDFENRLIADEILYNNTDNFGSTNKNLIVYPAKTLSNKKVTKTTLSKPEELKANHVMLIKQRNIKTLQNTIVVTPKVVYSEYELHDYLKQQDLRKYLGIQTNNNFLDIFHDESDPSASIYSSNKKNGHQLYKCFSKSSEFCGTIFNITERLLNVPPSEAKEFLKKLYAVSVQENKQQKALKANIKNYEELLLSDTLEELYPNFYKVFNRYGYLQDLCILLDLVKDHLPPGEDSRLLFYHSIDTLSRKFSRSRSVTHTRMIFFTFFKFISKLEANNIPKNLLEFQQKNKEEKHHKYLNSTYELHTYNLEFFTEVDEKCALWLEKGCTSKSMNYEGIFRNFGRLEADRVFPQDKGKSIPPLNEDVTRTITKKTLELINTYGWTTEQEILDSVTLYFKGQKQFKNKQFKICLGEIMDNYDLERIRLNKNLKKELNIETNGYGYIIRPIGEKDASEIGTHNFGEVEEIHIEQSPINKNSEVLV